MGISYGDQLFVYYDKDNLPRKENFSFFGNDFGGVGGFYQYIQGYILAVKVLFQEYVNCDSYRNSTLDTIVYPICFCYRQIVELYIKYLFFKYSNVDNDSKEKFVIKVSHKLNKAWNATKPYIQKLLRKIDNPIEIQLIDDFINQIDKFDSDSFRMRYPIKKNLSSVHSKPVKLDVIGLHHKMMSLFELFKQLDDSIENVLFDNVASDDFKDTITELYYAGKADFISVIKQLGNLANIEKKDREQSQQYAESQDYTMVIPDIVLQPDRERYEFEQMVLQLPAKHAALLGLLTQAGRIIVDRRCRLSTEEEERDKDFIKLLELTLKDCSNFIDLDGCYPTTETCYIYFSVSAELLLIWLETSFFLMESCISLQ